MITAKEITFQTQENLRGDSVLTARLHLVSGVNVNTHREDFDPLLAKETVMAELMHKVYGELKTGLMELHTKVSLMDNPEIAKGIEALLALIKASEEVPNEATHARSLGEIVDAPAQYAPPPEPPMAYRPVPPPPFNWHEAEVQLRETTFNRAMNDQRQIVEEAERMVPVGTTDGTTRSPD